MERIDLSAVPSSMEVLASTWRRSSAPVAMRAAVKRPPQRAFEPAARHAPVRTVVDRPPAAVPAEEIEATRAARRDAMRSMAFGIPDPVRYARYIPADEAQALVGAERGCNGWRFAADVDPILVARMRAVGLAYLGHDRDLPIFAQAVRWALMDDDR